MNGPDECRRALADAADLDDGEATTEPEPTPAHHRTRGAAACRAALHQAVGHREDNADD